MHNTFALLLSAAGRSVCHVGTPAEHKIQTKWEPAHQTLLHSATSGQKLHRLPNTNGSVKKMKYLFLVLIFLLKAQSQWHNTLFLVHVYLFSDVYLNN